MEKSVSKKNEGQLRGKLSCEELLLKDNYDKKLFEKDL